MTTRHLARILALGAATAWPGRLCAMQSGGDSVAATRSVPIAHARTITTPPVIDGRLKDPAWQEAEVLTGFVQRELHEGQPVTERTEVRLLTDGDALYIGAWLYDADPSGIVPGDKVRDGAITNADYFGILLDTYHDRQNGFVFTTTPAGIEYDAQVVNEGQGGGIQLAGQSRTMSGSLGGFNLNWDGSWTVVTSTDSAGWYAEFRIPVTKLAHGGGGGGPGRHSPAAAGWYAEFRIPFTTLRYGGGSRQTWGLQLVRAIRRKNEKGVWSFVPRQFDLMKISRAGALED